MRRISFKTQFERDLKLMKRRGKNSDDLLAVARILAVHGRLPAIYRPHKLSGEWRECWECHIAHDWLLIYGVTDKEVILIRTGTHADLFE